MKVREICKDQCYSTLDTFIVEMKDIEGISINQKVLATGNLFCSSTLKQMFILLLFFLCSIRINI